VQEVLTLVDKDAMSSFELILGELASFQSQLAKKINHKPFCHLCSG
jgi:hypothetical protein